MMLDYLVEASHIAVGIGCTFDEALEIVKAARSEPEPAPADNVVYGVDFTARRIDHG